MAKGRVRRETRYPAVLNLQLTNEMKAALEREADAEETSTAAVARDAIRRGLPMARDARRKRERNAKRSAAGQGGAK